VLVDPALRARCLNILNTLDEKGLATQFDTVIREMASNLLRCRTMQKSQLPNLALTRKGGGWNLAVKAY